MCYLPIRGPGQRSALGGLSFAAGADHLLLQLVHDDFPFQILCRARKKSVREPGGLVARPQWPSPTPPTPKCSETASGFPQGCSQMALKFHHSTLVASSSRGRGQVHQFMGCDPSWWSHWPSRAPPLRSERQGANLHHEGGSKPSKTPSLMEISFFGGNSIWIRTWGDENQAATYPNLDAGAGGSAEPVAVGAEAQGVDDVPSVQRVEVFALIQIPQHGLAVLGGHQKQSEQTPQLVTPWICPTAARRGTPKTPIPAQRESKAPPEHLGVGEKGKSPKGRL